MIFSQNFKISLDVVGLQPNVANEEGLRFLRDASD